jgi:hypothetical protein
MKQRPPPSSTYHLLIKWQVSDDSLYPTVYLIFIKFWKYFTTTISTIHELNDLTIQCNCLKTSGIPKDLFSISEMKGLLVEVWVNLNILIFIIILLEFFSQKNKCKQQTSNVSYKIYNTLYKILVLFLTQTHKGALPPSSPVN